MFDIIVPTYSGHYVYMQQFLDTFRLNCMDANDVNINLIVSSKEEVMFKQLQDKYKTLNVNIIVFCKLVKKYDNIDIDEDELLTNIGRFNYQSLKKLYGALNTDNDNVCLFDSECLFIRNFTIKDYIEQNKNIYYYCSKMTKKDCGNTHGGYMQRNLNNIFNTRDMNWYLETYVWILRKDILNDLHKYLTLKFGKLAQMKQEFFIEYCYFLFVHLNQNKYDNIIWIDTLQVICDNLSTKTYNYWVEHTHPWCMMEHIGLHLKDATYEQLEAVRLIYDLMQFPQFRLIGKNKNNQLALFICPQIKICVSENCPEVYELVMKDFYNKKWCICVSGLVRKCDNINTLLDFVYPLSMDTYYYLSAEDSDIHRILANNKNAKSIIINNTKHQCNTNKIKYLPPSKSSMVINTSEMFYKKSTFMKYLTDAKYDMIVMMRPDLISFNGRLIDLIYEVMKKYDTNTMYVPIMYSSVGVAATFAISSCQNMKLFMNIYNQFDNYISQYIFNPELFIYYVIKKNNINVKTLNWQYKINWHSNGLLNEWWRHEPDLHINDNNFMDFADMRVESYQNIMTTFTNTDKKYTLTNVESKKSLYVPKDLQNNAENSILISLEKSSTFHVIVAEPVRIRVNIKLDKNIENMNHDASGWNIFTKPKDKRVFGKGNSGRWAQFYLIKENDYYYIATFHSVNGTNTNNTFGRYLGVNDDILVADMPKCKQALWEIK